ncbi:response regulator transcription factor [Paenibacillus spongiae]|uniref:Response regulator n=1 Tax=Paenibacillus spongiae TaxID=2909671 RepID=A0ABY5S8I5_9BACL|nr:response regulator [Paenibacillus spongiae]UVI29142.1 response regulator [Paenibacillus spongiae]
MMSKPVLTVLIVDDEQPLREDLRSFPWPDYGAELAGEAENGEEALQMCDGLRPDVVITDITMPVMDGLELCRRLRGRYPLTQIVLLTCHSEFEYAREALKLGALDYLIKVALDEEDMRAVLDKAREAIRREYANRRSERYGRRTELSRLLAQLLKEGEGPDDLVGRLWAGDASAIPEKGEVASPLITARLHAVFKPEYRYEVIVALHQALDEQRLLPHDQFDWTPLGESDHMLWFNSASSAAWDREQFRQTAEKLMIALQHGLDRQLPYLSGEVKLYTLLGGPVTDTAGLLAAIKRSEPGPSIAYFHNSGEVLSDSQAAGRPESAESGTGEPRKWRKEVQLAMQLMARKLAEPITLTSIAEEVGLSSFYLSRLFREETGESFNDYLTRLRIDQAIRLLQTTSLKVYEVAGRVGIPSYRYFSVVFRGRTGVSPTEFKKG